MKCLCVGVKVCVEMGFFLCVCPLKVLMTVLNAMEGEI